MYWSSWTVKEFPKISLRFNFSVYWRLARKRWLFLCGRSKEQRRPDKPDNRMLAYERCSLALYKKRKRNDSVITPRSKAGVVTNLRSKCQTKPQGWMQRLKMNLRSPSLIPHRLCRIRYQIPVSFHVTARTKSELELSVSESGNEELCSELSA